MEEPEDAPEGAPCAPAAGRGPVSCGVGWITGEGRVLEEETCACGAEIPVPVAVPAPALAAVPVLPDWPEKGTAWLASDMVGGDVAKTTEWLWISRRFGAA